MKLRRLAFALLVTGVLLAAAPARTAPSGLVTSWLAPSDLVVAEPQRYHEYGAVVVYRERHIRMLNQWGADGTTMILDHAAIAILDPSGQGHANVRVWYRGDWKVQDFQARTVAGDGTIREVSPENVYDEKVTAKAGDDEGWSIKVFAFPRVEPGVVLEYRYLLVLPYARPQYWEYCVDDLPVVRYDLTVQTTPETVLLLKIYNTRQKIVTSTEDGLVTLKWTLKDLRPPPDETNAPAKQLRAPWWVSSMVQFTRGQSIIHLSTRWEHALRWYFKRLVTDAGDDMKGYKCPLAKVDGEPPARTVQRAFEWVRDTPVFQGFQDFSDLRPLAKTLRTGRAGSFEGPRLLQQILSDLGIRADVAFLRRWQSGAFDATVPATFWLNHMLVRVPAQDGIPEAFWLDPSCRYCAPGTLPFYDQGVDAVVMKMQGRVMQDLPDWEMARPAGTPANADGFRRSFVLDVDAAGRMTGTLAVEMAGDEGEQHARSARDEAPGAQRRRFEGYLAHRFPGGKLLSFEEDLGGGPSRPVRYVLRFETERATSRAPGEVWLPLDFLSSGRERQSWPDQRTQNLVIRDPEEFQETVEVRGPKGWEVRVDPIVGRVDGEVASAECRLGAEDGGTVRASRSLSLRRGSWNPDRYGEVPKAIALMSRVKHVAVRWVDPRGVPAAASGPATPARPVKRPPAGRR